nr:hypothetical protein [Tanacetum cinerariifolium]
MDVAPSPDRVFDFPMAEPEPHPAYDFFTAEPILGLAQEPENDDEWLMAPVTPSGASVTLLMIDDLCVRMGNLEYEQGALVKKMGTMSDDQVIDGISIGEIWLRVTTIKGQVQVMVSQAVQVLSRLEEIETRVQQMESRVDTHLSDHMTRLDEMETRKSTLMSYMLWMEERLIVLEKKLPGLPPGPQ